MLNTDATAPFCHLHVHSEYSLLDGAIRISDLLSKVAKLGHSACALTDHGNLFGAVEFYSKAKEKKIKPIIGAELFCSGSEAIRSWVAKFDPELAAHLHFKIVLLAKDLVGYKNLVKIVSAGYLGKQNVQIPIVASEVVLQNAQGLLAIASCNGGEFAYLVRKIRSLQARSAELLQVSSPEIHALLELLQQHVSAYKDAFGGEHFYVELTQHNLPDQKRLLQDLSAAAKHLGLPLVASANAHYLEPEDKEAHTVLMAIKHELKLNALRARRKNVRAHLLNNEEFQELFAAWPEAIANTLRIAEQCNVNFDFGTYHLPKFELGTGETAAEGLTRLAKEGLEARFTQLKKIYGPTFDEQKQNEYRERLQYELDVIMRMGFAGYFLIVQDFINWAKTKEIPVGPGRGSGAGSIVAFALRITDLDPIPYNLIFERFLNPDRISMPDFDVDFCQERRDEVLKYVTARYGHDHVAQITTFGKMLARGVLRDVGRVLDISYGKVDRIAKLVPNALGIKLQDAIKTEPRIKEEANRDPMIADMLAMALKLEGLSRHTSVHAAGIVISDEPMQEYVPVYQSEDGSLITQFEMKNVEKIGLVKFDFLGLKTLTVIDKAVKLIRKTKNSAFDINDIPLNDRKVYDLIASGFSIGVFQLESPGMQQLSTRLKPDKFEDVIAQVALFRPGPLNSGMADDFVERKHGRQKIEYIRPELEPILKDTYGTIVYQEQVQKIASVLANYSLGEADILRKAMGKKKPEEMEKQKNRFVEGCNANGLDTQTATELFDHMAKFAEYGFNKSHSAAYGLISYQTAYLKAYFPEEFMAATMSSELANTDKLVRFVQECKRMGVKVIRPSLNKSQLEFSVPMPGAVEYGLAAIKGIGPMALEPLLAERARGGPFTSIGDLVKRVDLHKVGKKTMELLIAAGAMDEFGYTRQVLFAKVADFVRLSETVHTTRASGQGLLFSDAEEVDNQEEDIDGRLDLGSEFFARGEILKDEKANAWLIKEKDLLGVYLSSHPMELFTADVKVFAKATTKDIFKFLDRSGVVLIGILVDKFERVTKEGKRQRIVRIEDQYGQVSVTLFENDPIKEVPPIDSPVVCSFKVQKGFENLPPRLKLESIQSLEKFREEKIRTLAIYFDKVFKDEGDYLLVLKELKKVIKHNPGNAKVVIHLQMEAAKLQFATRELKVKASDDVVQGIYDLAKIVKIPGQNAARPIQLSYIT